MSGDVSPDDQRAAVHTGTLHFAEESERARVEPDDDFIADQFGNEQGYILVDPDEEIHDEILDKTPVGVTFDYHRNPPIDEPDEGAMYLATDIQGRIGIDAPASAAEGSTVVVTAEDIPDDTNASEVVCRVGFPEPDGDRTFQLEHISADIHAVDDGEYTFTFSVDDYRADLAGTTLTVIVETILVISRGNYFGHTETFDIGVTTMDVSADDDSVETEQQRYEGKLQTGAMTDPHILPTGDAAVERFGADAELMVANPEEDLPDSLPGDYNFVPYRFKVTFAAQCPQDTGCRAVDIEMVE